jgi:hypothetical protein
VRLGVPELLILIILVLMVVPLVLAVAGLYGLLSGKRAKRLGYPSTRAYLNAAPRSDAEKRDAVDLAMRGVVFCALGIVFAPVVLVGLVPLFYGGRKLVFASMGLGLVDDADQPDA